MSTARPGRGSSMGDSIFIDPYEPEYPESDGEPMADSTLQFQWIVTIKEGIAALFADRDDVFVAGDLLWYATKNDKNDVVAPDVLVVFGRPKGHRRSYREWAEEGVVPQVVFEIGSRSNAKAEMARKLAIYDRRGVEEYYYYRPRSGKLEGWIRDGGNLRPIVDFDAWRSPRLGIAFEAPNRRDALIVRGPDGRRFLTFQEIKRLADEERRRRRRAQREARDAQREAREQAEQAQAQRRMREAADLRAEVDRDRAEGERLLREQADARAEAERRSREAADARAEAERQLREEADLRARIEGERAERLAALLRNLGVDPD